MKGGRVIARILAESETVPRIARRQNQPLRDYPTYTIPEAAISLGIPIRTLRYWVLDEPLWQIAGHDLLTPLLSFRDVANAYYIELVRSRFKLSVAHTRRVMENAKKESKAAYPLLGKNIRLMFKHFIMDKPARGKQPRRTIDLSHHSRHRQMVIPEVADQFSTRITWDRNNNPLQIFPWRYWTGPEDKTQPVSMDPNIMSGRLVVAGTRVPVRLVLVRSQRESIPEIAKDYELPEDTIEQALRHIVHKKAA